jgi:uncharacterized protein
MLGRDGHPAGVPCFVVTSQPDAEAAARFYCELFGRTAQDQMPAGAAGHPFAAQLDGRDVGGAKAFYGAVFGWEADDTEYGGAMWRLPGYADFLEQFDPGLRQRHSDFGAPPGFSEAIGWLLPLDEGSPQWTVTFSVGDADELADRAVQLGGTVVSPPADVGPTRVAVLRDPQGAELTISQFRP